MNYLFKDQLDWDQFNQSLSTIFGVEYKESTYIPEEVIHSKHRKPWNKGLFGDDNTQKGQIPWNKGKTMSQEHKDKMKSIMSKVPNAMHDTIHRTKFMERFAGHWILTDPNGIVHHVHGLAGFCKEHNLTRTNLIQRGKWKGWTCTKVETDQSGQQ